MAETAYKKIVKLSTASSSGSWASIDNMDDFGLTRGGEVLDDTVFEGVSHSGFHSRLVGLRDWSITGSGNYSTAAGQETIRTTWLNRYDLWAAYLFNGTAGYWGKVVVETGDEGGAVADKETWSFTLQADGALAAASSSQCSS